MKLINEELLNKAHQFLKNITEEDRVAVFHHTDPDGVTSGVITSKGVEKLRNKKIDFRINQKSYEIFVAESTMEELKKHNINKVITTDMALDQDVSENFIEKVAEFAEILVIDHHKIYRDLNSDRITIIKPDMIYENVNPSQYCTAKFTYDIFSQLINMEELDWVSCIGIIGDCGYQTWQEFVESTMEKYNIPLHKDPFRNEIGQIAEILSSTEAYDINKIKDAYYLVYNATSHKDLLNSELVKYKEEIEKEIKLWRFSVNEKAEINEELSLIYYELINPKFPVKSNLCTFLSYDFPNKTVVILQETENDEQITISARRRDNKLEMNDLLEFATDGLEKAGGGGHKPAAGGRILKKDKQIFKERVIKWLTSKNT